MRTIVAFAALFGALRALDRPLGPAPALGPYFSPFRGAWARGGIDLWNDAAKRIEVPGLQGRVTVRSDRDGVKHIFAANDDDLYFAEGFVVASDRLWQMEFFYRLAAGRLSEALGPKALKFDELFLKFGLPQAARESAELMMQDPATRAPLARYAEGVNAYVALLRPEDLPFEFKLLGYAPERWTPDRAAYVMKFMAFNLAAFNRELPLSRSQARLSPADFDDLFPLDMPIPEPIIPRGHKWNFKPLAPPAPRRAFHPNVARLEAYPQPSPSNGSNNWAVSGRHSTTGRPILSNDIHLDYSLPTLWYEVQLSSPTQNVYGVALPGAPGIVLGFNSKLAWAVTNGGSDVLDWYELRFRDDKRREYLHGGEWRPVIETDAVIKVKGAEAVHLSLKRAHYGPIVYDATETPAAPWIPRGLAMRWAPLDPSNEIRAFLALNRARSVAECHEAIAQFNWPDQNFLCADEKDIGLWHNGQYPIRWKGQGRTISDGTSSEYDWSGWVPRDQVPGEINPERGFLSSANQAPTDASYQHYLGWPFEEPYRALRINELLRAKPKLAPRDLVEIQGDVESRLAREVLPAMLAALPETRLMTDREREIANELRQWDYKFDLGSRGAPAFHAWWDALERAIWSEKFPDSMAFAYPPEWRTASLIVHDPKSRHFDRLSTPDRRETLADHAWASFQDAERDLAQQMGASPSLWTWGRARSTAIPHPLKIGALGRSKVATPGDRLSPFANTGTHGPVWKMIVALGGDEERSAGAPKAWAIYPGGQSGDPMSSQYDEFIDRWSRNELRELHYLATPQSTLANASGELTMEPH